jgi:RNA polymerase sigma-70 factor (sigma-E family)
VVGLFRSERLAMVQLAHVMLGSNAVAEETVQEAFIRLRAAWPGGVTNPGGYLRTVVVNLALNHIRRGRVERRHATKVVPEPVVTGDPEVDETWAAVCRLPERQRAVLALRFYEDMSEADIAAVLGCRPGTVKSAVHRGLATLRRELS